MGSIPVTQGYHHVRVVADPGANNEFQIGPIVATRMRIIGLRFRFITGAAVADRRVNIEIRNAATVCCELINAQIQTATLTYYYNLWPGYSGDSVMYGGEVMMPWSMQFMMDQVFYIQSSTTNMAIADAFSQIVYCTEEWISEP